MQRIYLHNAKIAGTTILWMIVVAMAILIPNLIYSYVFPVLKRKESTKLLQKKNTKLNMKMRSRQKTRHSQEVAVHTTRKKSENGTIFMAIK